MKTNRKPLGKTPVFASARFAGGAHPLDSAENMGKQEYTGKQERFPWRNVRQHKDLAVTRRRTRLSQRSSAEQAFAADAFDVGRFAAVDRPSKCRVDSDRSNRPVVERFVVGIS